MVLPVFNYLYRGGCLWPFVVLLIRMCYSFDDRVLAAGVMRCM